MGCCFSSEHKVIPTSIRVIDGDTIEYVSKTRGRLEKQKLRIIGVDTPEKRPRLADPNHDLHKDSGIAVSEYVKKLVDENFQRVRIELVGTRDFYGRNLGHLFIGSMSLSEHLITAGLGARIDKKRHVWTVAELERARDVARRHSSVDVSGPASA